LHEPVAQASFSCRVAAIHLLQTLANTFILFACKKNASDSLPSHLLKNER